MRRQRSHRGDDRSEAPPLHDVLVNRRYVKIEVSPCVSRVRIPPSRGVLRGGRIAPRCSPTRASDQPAL
jgi:hypothetical protein